MFNEDRKTLYFVHLDKYNEHSKDSDKDDKTDSKISDNTDSNISDEPILTDNNSDKNQNLPKNETKSFWSKYKVYIIIAIIIIVLIVGVIFGYIFGRKVWEKHRKTRANELIDDNYEYKENEDNKIIN